jgi:hypothetical protein
MSTFSEILISLLKVIPLFILISFTSFFLIKLLGISDLIEKILLIFLINWVQVIIIIEILSLFKKVSFMPLIIFHLSIFIVSLILSNIKKISYKLSYKNLKQNLMNFYKKLELRKELKLIIIVWLIIMLLITFFIGLTVPSKNWDSMTYHLTRAAMWQQNHSIDHYFTRNLRQVEMPMNAEIGFLWGFLITNSDYLSFILQWISLIIILLTLYKILKLLEFNETVSLITSFIFSTLNIILLEASTTQNDLIATSFIILTIYFVVLVLKSEKIIFKYIIIAGMSAGMAIGSKSFSYLFIPGLLLFLILYGKNNRIKWIKISYIVIFSLIGCFILASYGIFQNYLYFGSIFSSKESLSISTVNNPGIKNFISNLLKQSASFYDLKEFDFNSISRLIEKILNFIHAKIKIDISSPDTTWIGTQFAIFKKPINMDTAYFGPISYFLILPAVFYNSLFFLFNKKFRTDSDSVEKYKNTLKLFAIPVIFYLIYNFMFKWNPWLGRTMIPFVLLMMFSFALLIDLLKKIKFKKLFTIIIYIILFISILFSIKVLFNADDPKIISRSGQSIYNVNYDDRRYSTSRWDMKIVKDSVDTIFKENAKIGLITGGDDWDYIYFGKHFKRTLHYLTNEEWSDNSIDEMLSDKNLDGIIINTDIKEFSDGTFPSIIEKITNITLLKIDKSNFQNYIRPLNGCEFINDYKINGIPLKVLNDDPYLETTFPFKFDNEKSLIVLIVIESPAESVMQIFYSKDNSPYNEKDSEMFNLIKGVNNIYIKIGDIQKITSLRIDPLNVKADCIIDKIEIFSIQNINYKILENFVLLYK